MNLRMKCAGLAAHAILLLGSNASRAELCNTESSGKDAKFYPGESAGYVYDRLFADSKHRLSHLDYIPQGLATYSNYQGQDDMILVTSYKHPSGPALIVGIQATTGVTIGAVKVDSHHAGGIAVFEKLGWVFVSGPKFGDEPTISRFSLAEVKKIITDPTPPAEPARLAAKETKVFATSSFLTSHGPTSTLWVGNHDKDDTSYMVSYKVRESGELVPEPGKWEVPMKSQGLVVTKDSFIFSTSLGRNNRSNIYVVRRDDDTHSLNQSQFLCFRAPSMAEGMAVYGDKLFLIFESGADYYRNMEDKPRNIIKTWHQAPLAQLEALPPRE